MLLYNGTIHPMTGDPIAKGYVRVQGTKIESLGAGACAPLPGEETLDLQGGHLYPGFIDSHTHLGMWEDGLDFEGDDGNEETDPVTPQLRAIDAVNPLDRCFQEALEGGVTTVVTGPGSANPIGGQMAALKTAGRRIEKMIVKAPVAIKMALGENPKSVYNGKNQTPMTRMATAALIREQLFKAQEYQEQLEKAEASRNDPDPEREELDKPEFDLKCESLLPALRREIQVHFHAHRADDIFTAIRLGEEFHLDYVIVHGTEGHLIAQELVEAGAKVLSGPFLSDRSKPELRNLTAQSPGLLSKAGLHPAIVTDHPVIPVQYLRLCAGLAVAEGMDREEALRAITIYPARLCRIDHRVGSIEPGKDADLTLFTEDPLALGVKPKLVLVNGAVVHTRLERRDCHE
ncbi:MAG: amidohydrolase [Oscillospiraceae bacterium]|nr:amidohydrolase [Oscillospiraceae bacterium]